MKVIGPPPAGGVAVPAELARRRPAPRRERAAGAAPTARSEHARVSAPGHGPKVAVKKGEEVEAGALVCVIEAMKMENEITAHRSGKVEELSVAEGGSVAAGDTIARIK